MPLVPAAVTVAVPVEAPKHDTLVCANVSVTLHAGEPTVVVDVAVHPFASVTVILYVPADKPVAVAVV